MDHATEIANLKARYCLASDMCTHDEPAAREIFATLFTDDFTGDYGMVEFANSAALGDFMAQAIGGGSEWMVHMLHSPLIQINGTEATGDWTVSATSKKRADGELQQILGRYSDKFRLTDKGWRISRITFNRQEL